MESKKVRIVCLSTGMLANARAMRLYEDLTWHRDPEDVKRERLAYQAEQKARYAPHRKYGFVKNLKK